MPSSRPTTTHVPPVVVHGERITAHRAATDLPPVETRHRFGGTDPAAAISGALAGLGLLALGSVAAAAVYWRIDGAATDRTRAVAAVVVGALALLAAGVCGWVTGRASRYDGARNGALAGLLLLVLAGGTAALAAVQLQDVDRPGWLGQTPDGLWFAAAAASAAGTNAADSQ